MSLSKWYSNLSILPGSMASEIVVGARFSNKFPWKMEDPFSKLTYYISCKSDDSFQTPELGKELNIIKSGLVETSSLDRKFYYLFSADSGLREKYISSSSSSYSSESQSSCSESLSSSSQTSQSSESISFSSSSSISSG